MALEFAHGAIRWLAADAVNTTYVVSGLAFQPKALRFYWIGLDSAGTDVASEAVNSRRGVGFAVSTSSRRSVGSFSQDTAATSNCGTVASNDCVACTTNGAGARDGLLDISAIASDGFTLIVDDQGVADITVFWEAWGGSDITVAAVGDIAEPAATGNQDYTVTGFVSGATDQVVMLAGVQSVAAVNTAEAEASGMFIGFAASATAADNICVSGNSDDASTAMDTDGHCISDECLGMVAKAGAATVATRAVLTQFGTDNFRLNWSAISVTNRRSIFLAIKGGRWQSGSITIAGNTLNNTSAVSNTIFTPIGMCLIGRMTAEQATNVATANDRIGIGTGTSTTSRRSMGMLDEDATASSACEIDTTIQYDQVLCYPSTAGALLTAYDISSMDTAGFTLINDLAGGVASEWIGYLTFGNPVAKAGTESVPTGLTETASAGVVLVAPDSLTAQVIESASLTLIALNASDSVAVSVSETDITAFEYNLIESLPINLTESASVDTGSVTPIAASESLPIGLTESAVLYVRQDASDSLTVNISDAALPLVHQFVSDTPAVGITEAAMQIIAQSSSESILIGLTESAAQTVSQFVNESLPLGLTEQATEQISASASDSLQVGLTDSATVDAGDIVTQAAIDNLIVGLTESALISTVNLTATDNITLQLTESTLTVLTDSASDSLAVQLTEQATVEDLTTGFLAKAASDTLPIGLTEQTSGYSAGSGSDAIFGLQESAVVLVYTATTDSITVGLQDTSRAVSVTLQVADTLPLGYTEAVLQHIFAVAADTLPMGFTESALPFVLLTGSDSLPAVLSEALLILNRVAVQDSLAVILLETGSPFNAGDLIDNAGAENIRISLTESGVLYTRTVGTLSPLIATAEYIGIDSRTVESLGLPKTAHPVDGGLPHDAEVIVGV